MEAFRQCGSFCASFCAFPVFDYIIGPPLTRMETIDLRDSYDHDFVAVIRCDDKRGWPSTNLIHQCMVSECHVVLVGHTMSPIYNK